MIPYETALTLTPGDQGRSRFVLDASWAQGRSAFGGLIGGIGVRAAQAVLPADRPIRSVLVDFAAPIAPGEGEVVVRPLRAGRSLSHVEVEVLQGGEVAAVVVVIAGTSRPSLLSVAAPATPPSPAPAAAMELPYLEGATPVFTRNFEYRWVSPRFPFTGADRANLGGYIRRRDGGSVDVAGILALLDAWPAPVLPLLSRPAAASSVTWMVNLSAVPPVGGWPGDGYFRFEGDAVAAHDGYADVTGRLWAPDGALVASSHQLVAEFSA